MTVAASLADEFLKPFLRPSKLHSIYSKTRINQVIDSIFLLVNPLDKLMLKGFNGELYVNSYYNNLEKKYKDYTTIFELSDSLFIVNDNHLIKLSNSYTPYMHIKDNLVKEYLWGIMLNDVSNIFQKQLDKRILTHSNFIIQIVFS